MQTIWSSAVILLLGLVVCLKALPFSVNSIHNIHPLIKILKAEEPKQPEVKFGTLKLCPPGGRSFFEAFQLACPMRRRKRSPTLFDFDRSPNINSPYRPATIDEIMKICCVQGCEFTDFFPHCGPFAAWK